MNGVPAWTIVANTFRITGTTVVVCMAVVLSLASMESFLRSIQSVHPPVQSSLYVLGIVFCQTTGIFFFMEGMRRIPGQPWTAPIHWVFGPCEVAALVVLGAFSSDRWALVGCAAIVRTPGHFVAWMHHQPAETRLGIRVVTALVFAAILQSLDWIHPLFCMATVATKDLTVGDAANWVILLSLMVAAVVIRLSVFAFFASALVLTKKPRYRKKRHPPATAAKILSDTLDLSSAVQPEVKAHASMMRSVSLADVDMRPEDRFRRSIAILFPVSLMFSIAPVVSVHRISDRDHGLFASFALLLVLQKPLWSLLSAAWSQLRDKTHRGHRGDPLRVRVVALLAQRRNLFVLLHE
ncbi:hypothetical protein DFJ73DRAFT_659982, partial [Zopfochytrium polystomum]